MKFISLLAKNLYSSKPWYLCLLKEVHSPIFFQLSVFCNFILLVEIYVRNISYQNCSPSKKKEEPRIKADSTIFTLKTSAFWKLDQVDFIAISFARGCHMLLPFKKEVWEIQGFSEVCGHTLHKSGFCHKERWWNGPWATD